MTELGMDKRPESVGFALDRRSITSRAIGMVASRIVEKFGISERERVEAYRIAIGAQTEPSVAQQLYVLDDGHWRRDG